MKARTRISLVACLVIVIFKNVGADIEISSQVDLDSDENEETKNLALDKTRKLNSPANPSESVLHTSKQPVPISHRRSELVKSNESRRSRIYTSHVSDIYKR